MAIVISDGSMRKDLRFGVLLDDHCQRVYRSGPVVGNFLQFAFQNNLFHFSPNGQFSNLRVSPDNKMVRKKRGEIE